MTLNWIALWFATIPAATLLWRSVREPRRAPGWLAVSLIVLFAAAIGWLLFRESAGYIASALFVLLVLIPSWASSAAGRASEAQRYGRARLLSRVAALLHPVDGWRVTPRVFHAFQLAQAGQIAEAEALLQVVARGPDPTASMAGAQRLRLLGRWRELKSLGERRGLLALQSEPTLLVLYLRALGELGYVDELAAFMLAQEELLAGSGAQDQARLYLFAFTGQVELTRQALNERVHGYSAETRDFWVALATQSAGLPEEARREFGRLRESQDAQIRARAEERFERLLRAAPEEPPSAQTLATVNRFARAFAEKQKLVLNSPVHRQQTPVTLALVIANAAVYLAGSYPMLLETRLNFEAEWSFFPPAIFEGQWWRTLSYLFVHANALHLLMNLGGLWVLGPFVERAFGRVRFLVVYLVAGCAGSAVYLSLALWHPGAPVTLVGASGSIMGLLGAAAAVMLRAWRRQRAPFARQVFLRLLAIVALQVAFDAATPEVAGLAHAIGLLSGFACALLLSDRLSAPAGASARA